MPANNIVTFPKSHLTGGASFHLATELLMMTLDEQDDEVLIETQNFFHKPGVSIKTNGSIKVVIDNRDVMETEGKLEVFLSGRVENHLEQKKTCSLYFCMWVNRNVSLFKNSCRKQMEIAPVTITLTPCSEGLADSVFGLDLYTKDHSDTRCSLGHGRGYLVFDPQE